MIFSKQRIVNSYVFAIVVEVVSHFHQLKLVLFYVFRSCFVVVQSIDELQYLLKFSQITIYVVLLDNSIEIMVHYAIVPLFCSFTFLKIEIMNFTFCPLRSLSLANLLSFALLRLKQEVYQIRSVLDHYIRKSELQMHACVFRAIWM